MIDELRARFRDRFIETARQRLGRATAALDEPSGAAVVRHELHALAGEAAMLGLDAMSQTARDGELSAKKWEQGDAESKPLSSRAVHNLGFQLDGFASDDGNRRVPRPTLPPGQKRRVLVVDESLIVAEQLCDELDAEGLETRAAANMPEALAAIAEFRPHVIAADDRIAGPDVASLCVRLRGALATRRLSIVLISNLERAELERVGRAAGADACASRMSGLPAVVESIVSTLGMDG